MHSFTLIAIIIAVALAFDFFNGFHDAANSIATVVSTRVLTPLQAVMWAAFFNFIAAFFFGTTVAGNIAKDLVHPEAIDIYVVFGGLIGAITWNIITWLLALPTSSSHAILSGIAGAAVTKSGFSVLIMAGWAPLLAFIVLSPLFGMILGMVNMVVVSWLFRRATPHKVDKLFRRLQLVSAGIYSLGHGGNDAQKTMGIIVMLLVAGGYAPYASADPHSFFNHFHLSSWLGLGAQHNIAWWIVLSCHAAMGLGTVFGGWRIVKTMGSGITRLQPVGGFCAETAAASTIIFATASGIPISTTHAITGSILGVGTARNHRSVRWIWGERIVVAWVLTIPCAAFISAISYVVIRSLLAP